MIERRKTRISKLFKHHQLGWGWGRVYYSDERRFWIKLKKEKQKIEEKKEKLLEYFLRFVVIMRKKKKKTVLNRKKKKG